MAQTWPSYQDGNNPQPVHNDPFQSNPLTYLSQRPPAQGAYDDRFPRSCNQTSSNQVPTLSSFLGGGACQGQPPRGVAQPHLFGNTSQNTTQPRPFGTSSLQQSPPPYGFGPINGMNTYQSQTQTTQTFYNPNTNSFLAANQSFTSNRFMQIVPYEAVRPPNAIDDAAQAALLEMYACKALFDHWGDQLDKMGQDEHAVGIRGIVQLLQSNAWTAVIASLNVVDSHKRLCSLVASNLRSASIDPSGQLQHDNAVAIAGKSVQQNSASLCMQIDVMEEGMKSLVEEIELLRHRNKQIGFLRAKIHKVWTFIPTLIRTIGSVIGGIGTIMGFVHPMGLAASAIMTIVKTALSKGADVLEKSMNTFTHGAQEAALDKLCDFIRVTIPQELRKAQEKLAGVRTSQAAVQLHAQLQVCQMCIEPSIANQAANEWEGIAGRLGEIVDQGRAGCT